MKNVVFLLILTDVVFTFGAGLYGPIYAIFVENIGGDILEAGIAWAIFLMVMGTMEIPFGRLIDRYGKKKFLALAYLIGALCIFAYMFVSNIYELFALQVMVGVAFAMGDPAWDAWFSEAISMRESGFNWALFHAFTSYSQGFAAIVGGAVAAFLGFNSLFIIGGTVAVVSFFSTLAIKEMGNGGTVLHHKHRHHMHKRRHVYVQKKTPK
jgi:MFS family permease